MRVRVRVCGCVWCECEGVRERTCRGTCKFFCVHTCVSASASATLSVSASVFLLPFLCVSSSSASLSYSLTVSLAAPHSRAPHSRAPHSGACCLAPFLPQSKNITRKLCIYARTRVLHILSSSPAATASFMSLFSCIQVSL